MATSINIDKKIDNHVCPEPSICVQGSTCYTQQEREHMCYNCWLNYCKIHKIKIKYD